MPRAVAIKGRPRVADVTPADVMAWRAANPEAQPSNAAEVAAWVERWRADPAPDSAEDGAHVDRPNVRPPAWLVDAWSRLPHPAEDPDLLEHRVRVAAEARVLAEAAVEDAVQLARGAGLSWRRIGAALGVSDAAALMRYRHLDPR